MSDPEEKPSKAPAKPGEASGASHPAVDPEARESADSGAADPPADEQGGPKGKEPTRYGDWENKGIAWDF